MWELPVAAARHGCKFWFLSVAKDLIWIHEDNRRLCSCLTNLFYFVEKRPLTLKMNLTVSRSISFRRNEAILVGLEEFSVPFPTLLFGSSSLNVQDDTISWTSTPIPPNALHSTDPKLHSSFWRFNDDLCLRAVEYETVLLWIQSFCNFSYKNLYLLINMKFIIWRCGKTTIIIN